jgi:hypothetical protein
VVGALKKSSEELAQRGAASYSLLGREWRTASFETLCAWAMGVDKTKIVNDQLKRLFDLNPAVRLDLLPGDSAGNTVFSGKMTTAKITTAQAVVTGMANFYRRVAGKDLPADLLTAALEDAAKPSGVLGAQAAARQVKGLAVFDSVDRYVDLRLRSLGAEERGELMETVVSRMIADGTLYPNMRTLRANTANANTGNRATLAAEIRGGVELLLAGGKSTSSSALQAVSNAVAQAIKRLKVPSSELIDDLVNAVDANMSDVVGAGLVEDIRDVMRGYGFSSMHNVAEGTKTELLGGFLGLDMRSPQLLGVGPEYVASLQKLELQAANGELVSKLERLQTKNILASGDASQLAMYLVLEGLAFSKSMAQSGLLAAGTAIQMPLLPLIPNGRYLGVNILTNPLIMMTTVGPKRAAFGLRQASSRLVDVVTRRPPDRPVFVDVNGKPWAQQDLEAAYLRSNIVGTTADMNQAADFYTSLRTRMRLMATAESLDQMGWARAALAQLDPTQSNIFQRFAVECDMTMRKAVFASALRDGIPEAQAAKLARESTLDYGNIPDSVKVYANRYILFASFQIASTKALLEALTNDPETFIRVARLQMRQQQAAGAWYYGDDSNRVRVFAAPASTGPNTDNVPAFIAGPQNPILASYWKIITLMGWAGELTGAVGIGPEPVAMGSRAVEGVLDEQIQPLAQAGLAMITTAGEGSMGRLVQDDWVSVLQTYPDVWASIRAQCGIQEVPLDRRRPGAPTFEGAPGIQYQFTTKAGYRTWQLYMYAATQARMGRTSTDTEKALIAGDVTKPGYNPKYRALANPFLYYVGAQTPLRGVTPEEIQRRALQTAEREVR